MLIAMIEEPEWVEDMFDTYLDRSIQHFNMIWDAGYHFDSIFWYDDMGYKNTPFFSNEMYRSLLQKYHQKGGGLGPRPRHLRPAPLLRRHHAPAARHHGHRHRCVKPHRDQSRHGRVQNQQDYGDRLVLHGGINAVLWDDKAIRISIEAIRQAVPVLKENGGYIFASDHSIPNSVSLENMRSIINTVKEAGKY